MEIIDIILITLGIILSVLLAWLLVYLLIIHFKDMRDEDNGR